MKILKKIVYFPILATTLVGCGSKGSTGVLSYIKNIGKAKSIFIGSARKTRSNDGASQKLYMINSDGKTEELTFVYSIKNGNKNEERSDSKFVPVWISEINDEFLTICLDNYTSGRGYEEREYYLLNKKTGRCYKSPECIGQEDMVCNSYDYRDVVPTKEIYHFDSAGNIYFGSGLERYFSKVDIKNPEKITLKKVSLKGDLVDSCNSVPSVSKEGYIAYTATNNSLNVNRLIKPDGSFLNLNLSNWWTDFWTGYDGNLYTFDSSQIIRLAVSDSGVDKIVYGNTYSSSIACYYTKYESNGRFYLDGLKTIVQKGYDGFVEVYNESANTTSRVDYETLEISRPKIVCSSNNCLFCYGQDLSNNSIIYKIDIENGYEKTILMSNKYDLTSLSVSKDNSMSFTGLRFSDGAYVVGTLDASGNEKLSSVIFDNEVTSLINI